MEEFVSMLWKKKIYIIIIIILSTITGILYSYNYIRGEYKSSTTLILGRVNSSSDLISQDEETNQVSQSEIKLNSSLISTYNKIIKSDTLVKKIKDNLKLDINEKELKKSIEVNRISNTQIIEITAINKDNKAASEIANKAAELLSSKLKEIYNVSNVYIIDLANPEYEPYNINYIIDGIVSFVIGILISIIYVFIYSKLDKRVKNNSDIEDEIGLRLLITMPSRKRDKLKNQLDVIGDKSLIKEAFGTLRTNIQFSNINSKENKVILITSCFSSEGKSYIASNLAVIFAMSGKKVILIDADMNRGKQARIFNLPNNLGFSNYLSGLDKNGMEINERVNKFINETGIKNLNVITSGNIPPNPSELLTSSKLPELIKELNIFYDLIIFDGAPVLPVTDSLILSRMANSTILVSLYNRTKKDELYKAKKDIQNVGGTITGVVLNRSYIKENKFKNILKNEEYKEKNIKEKSSKIKLNAIKFKNDIVDKVRSIIKRKKDKPKLLEKGIYEEKPNEVLIEELQDIISPIITSSSELEESSENISLFVDDIIDSVYKEKTEKCESYNNQKNVYDNSSEEDVEKLKELERIENEKKKILKKEQLNKKKKAKKDKRSAQIENIKEGFITKYNDYKVKVQEKQTVKQKDNIEKGKILQERKIIEKEEKAKLARIKAEENIKNKEIKKLEKVKKNQEKDEKKKHRDMKKQKQKEEARIKEELLDDNLYPKTKFNKSLQ